MRPVILLILLFLISCTNREIEPPSENIPGYAPVYASTTAYQTTELQLPKKTVNAGKIYAYGHFIFQVDQGEGIHIVADAKTKNAKKIAFLKVPFCSDVAVKDNYLYINNLNDLLVFDISNTTSPQLIRRLPDAFPHINQQHPNVSDTYFECPDPAKGIIVRWEEKTLDYPKCRR